MITIKETYEIVTPESAELGDAEERGWIDDRGTPYSFSELVQLLHGAEASCSDINQANWATYYDYDTDYATGGVESRSYHPVTDYDLRYFRKALNYLNRSV